MLDIFKAHLFSAVIYYSQLGRRIRLRGMAILDEGDVSSNADAARRLEREKKFNVDAKLVSAKYMWGMRTNLTAHILKSNPSR